MNLQERIDKLTFKEIAYLASNSANIEVLNLIYNKNIEFLKLNFLSNKNTSLELLEKIYKNEKDENIIIKIIQHNNVSKEIIDDVFENKTKLSYYALNNPNISLDKLTKAFESSNKNILQMICANPSAPLELLENIFKKTKELSVLNILCRNKNCSNELLEDIFNYTLNKQKMKTSENVFNSIAGNINISEKLLNKVFKLNIDFVNESLAFNPKTPINFIEKFVLSENSILATKSIFNERLSDEFFINNWDNINERIRGNLASLKQRKLTDTQINLLVNDKSKFVRKIFALNQNIPKEILNKLLNDKYYKVRENAQITLNKIEELQNINNNVDLSKDFKENVFKNKKDFIDLMGDYENYTDILSHNQEEQEMLDNGIYEFI